MSYDALRDIPWIELVDDTGVFKATIRESLLRAHEEELSLNKKVPGYLYGAENRILRDVLAVVLRYEEGYRVGAEGSLAQRIIKEGISEAALDQALGKLSSASHLFSDTFPFLQRPPVKPSSAKDSARLLAPGKQPVKKLLPAMPADQGEDFWNLSVAQEESLGLAKAVQNLAIHHHYSMAGNNTYDGQKCAMGAPGIRFLGKGNTSTEIFWEGKSLLASLLQSLPNSWVEGQGLPAWADRLGETALTVDGSEHPLWAASWSSNTAACLWEGECLVGVRIGGIPDEWYLPTMGQDKDLRKAWWDQRNTQDPYYLYSENKQGELKAQRLDLGRDATDLAVEWASEDKVREASERRNKCFYRPDPDTSSLGFIRHQIEGTASSPSIRASQVYTPDEERWAFGQPEETQWIIKDQAHLLRKIHDTICVPFRRKNKGDEKSLLAGYAPVVLDHLEKLRPDVSAHYWRAITPVYEDFLRYDRGQASEEVSIQGLLKRTEKAALEAYDRAVLPYRDQNIARVEYVRGQLKFRIRKDLSPMQEGLVQEEDYDE